jgi:uncharacterized protein YaaQ
VEQVLAVLRRTSSLRQETLTPTAPTHSGEPYVPFPVEVTVGGATIFVLSVDRYEKF